MSASPRASTASAVAGVVDAVGRDQRNPDRAFHAPGDPRERRARHHRRDRRDARLVPADPGVDERRAGGFHRLRQRHHLVPRAAAFDQIEHRQPIDDDEIRARGSARAAHDFHRKAHAVLQRAAPFVVAVVGPRRDELVDEVALGAHDLDAVVTGALRELRATRIVGDRLPHAPGAQPARRERADRRPRPRRRRRQRVIRVAPRMQDLQRDLAASVMDRVGDQPVAADLPWERELRGLRFQASGQVGRNAARHHEADAAAGARRVELGHAREAVGRFLESRVHRAHQHAILERGEAEIERRQEVWVRRHGGHCKVTVRRRCRMPPCPTISRLPRLPALAQRLARRETTSRAIVDACLARIDALDGKLHAFVDVYRDDALKLADAADLARSAHAARGPLHGLPIALKDLLEMKDRQTTAGSKSWLGRISDHTATCVDKLLAAGMIPIGKTHMVEFAFGGWGRNQPMGAPWNPWDLATHRVAGGSSSGSAVAVASGMVPAAIGSDTGGSVRIPAALCGLTGLKTTYGLISLYGAVPLSTTLDSIGPLAHTVDDVALLTAAMAGPDPHDAATLGLPPIAFGGGARACAGPPRDAHRVPRARTVPRLHRARCRARSRRGDRGAALAGRRSRGGAGADRFRRHRRTPRQGARRRGLRVPSRLHRG